MQIANYVSIYIYMYRYSAATALTIMMRLIDTWMIGNNIKFKVKTVKYFWKSIKIKLVLECNNIIKFCWSVGNYNTYECQKIRQLVMYYLDE